MIDLSDPYVKLMVETLIKTATSKTIEFGIEGISKLLGKAVKEGNHLEAENIIKAESIEASVLQLTTEAISESYVVPFSVGRSANADDLLSLFVEVIKFGTNISKNLTADIFLPGSIIGEKTISCFASNGGEVAIKTRDRTIEFSFEPGSGMGIFYMDDPIDFCQRIKEKARVKRELTTSYLKLTDLYDEGHLLKRLTTRNVEFRNSQKITPKMRADLGMSGDSAPVQNWDVGIQMMLAFAGELADLDTLSPIDGQEVFSLLDRLAAYYERPA